MIQSFEPAGESLLGIQLFRELPQTERDAVAMRCQGKRVPAGHQLLRDGDESSDVYFIVSGKVRAAIYASSGKEVAFRDIGPGEAVGDLSALDGAPRSATVVAMEDSTVLSLSSGQFWEVLTQHQSVAAAMLRELTSLVRQLSQRVVEYSTLGVKNRIHAELLRLAEGGQRDGERATIHPVPTHAEIASRISTHREAVSRELSHLTSVALLERHRGSLVVCSLERLRQMVDDVKGA